MPETAATALAGVLVLATAVWIGGFLTVVVVSRVAARTLASPDRIAFFRCFGRAYGIAAGLALVIGLASGAALLADHPWDGTIAAMVALAAALLASTAVGVAQARSMTRLRRHTLDEHDEAPLSGRVRRGARHAAALRTLIGLLSLALLALGVLVAR